MSQIEITIGNGNPSVKINGEEMNSLITELSLDIKPIISPTLIIKMEPKDITVKGDALIIEQRIDS